MTTPIAVGYIRVHLLTTEQELVDTEERLAHFAATRGYHLSAVFAERPDSVPAAFIELITAVNCYRADAVVLPGLLHLAVLGLPPQIIHHLQALTGVQVLVADDPSEQIAGARRSAPTSSGCRSASSAHRRH